MVVAVEKPPVGERGIANPDAVPAWGVFGRTLGSTVHDLETVPDLRFPASVTRTYPDMRNDSQLTALRRGTFLPITRYAWGIDPNGARDAVVERITTAYNLPLIDDAVESARAGRSVRPIGRARDGQGVPRFSFSRHLDSVFKAPEFGFGYYEQSGSIGEDGLWHIRKLLYLPPRTITEINVAPDGGLRFVKQRVGMDAPELDVQRLVAYIWDGDPGDWLGRSMYRACYREWLLKDRLLRVDARNHEKGGGAWYGVASKDATPVEKQAIARAAAQMNALAGPVPALPAGAELKFERPGGNVSTIDSINRHDEAMARAWLLMAIQLGSTQTGARAVGEVHQDLQGDFQEAIAVWARDIFNEHVIEDDVDWNEGPGENFVPRLDFVVPKNIDPTAGLKDGSVTLDPATEAALNGAPPTKVAAIRAAYDRENRAYRARLARLLPDLLTEEELQAVGDIVAQDQAVEEQLHEALSELAVKPTRGVPAPRASAGTLGHREPNEHEVRAQVDFAEIDSNWQTQVDSLVARWQDIRATQIDELAALVTAAGGDLEGLAAIQAAAAGGELIAGQLKTMASLGAAEAFGEASRQGAAAVMADLADLEEQLAARAAALEQLLARSLSEAAARKAVQLTGGSLSASDVAASVRAYLDELTDTYLVDQFSGALSAAQNAGRMATMGATGPSRVYASELLDVNTCDPCRFRDGHEYDTLTAAAADYPAGGYRECQGGPRCRGTVVAVYDEAAPSEGAA